ncbi:hypothetical protein GGX14DRAFT_478276 [Mycena pura]|uniref:PEHE domain-containing protein n=1 Tax=Mycena pura TaxID=153505 RepID=A0AAD6Y2B2_9AGAR|nr:hypothetical protein GGX14DRAFT_478276 [Mycena pura]
MDDATLAIASSQIRQKRVLPSRSRRGGPGVGSCDVDIMILNAQSNKTESEPLIPADTPFVLKTDGLLEEAAKELPLAGGSGFNAPIIEGYFARPEVLKAYREQSMIETPEFTDVKGVALGSRLRQRPGEDNSDSDAVYEKRHRKYEAFEKRQRLREKEKLKHEQYKLKQRIEELRGMDNSAFLAAPASSFSPRPALPEVIEEDSTLGGMNANPAWLEGERRRKEMLMNAQALEERYRILLPPDRQRKPAGQNSVNASIEPDSELSAKEFTQPHDEGESEFDDPSPNKKETQKLKLKLPARPSVPTPTTTTPKVSATSKKRRRSHPPKSPGVKIRLGSQLILSTSEPGPSSLVEPEALPFQIVQYDPAAAANRPVRSRSERPRKRAKTAEPELPSQSPYSVSPAEPPTVVDKPGDSSPVHDMSQILSYPPPSPPSPEHYRPSPVTADRPHSPDRMSSMSPEPSERPSPPDDDEVSVSAPFPEDRKPSVPPIESISVPATTGRGRGRSRGVPTTSHPRKAPTKRRQPPCSLVVFATRTAVNPRQLHRSRHLEAFGVKLPAIIQGSDSYDFELPHDVTDNAEFEDASQNADISREFEGDEAPEDPDDLESQDTDGDEQNDPRDADTDRDSDGT